MVHIYTANKFDQLVHALYSMYSIYYSRLHKLTVFAGCHRSIRKNQQLVQEEAQAGGGVVVLITGRQATPDCFHDLTNVFPFTGLKIQALELAICVYTAHSQENVGFRNYIQYVH